MTLPKVLHCKVGASLKLSGYVPHGDQWDMLLGMFIRTAVILSEKLRSNLINQLDFCVFLMNKAFLIFLIILKIINLVR